MRKRTLPAGWYPDSAAEIRSLVDGWQAGDRDVIAGVVPHAGWAFCGSMIASVLRSFSHEIDTVVVLGGHNPPGGPLVSYQEDGWEFPSGVLPRDEELARRADASFEPEGGVLAEYTADNTVEVVMAMAAALYPRTRWAAWRVPADERSLVFGEYLHRHIRDLGRRALVVGSTDLTHYGENFGFMPPGSLEDPASWVGERDSLQIEALAGFRGGEALELAADRKSACSAGGAAAAMAYARSAGADRGRILEYRTSRDLHPSSSFVGYGSLVWKKDQRER